MCANMSILTGMLFDADDVEVYISACIHDFSFTIRNIEVDSTRSFIYFTI